MMNQTFNQKPYASGRLRALLTIVLLALGAAVGVLAMVVNAAMIGTLRGADDHSAPYEMGESITEVLFVLVTLLQVAVFIATVVAFLMWMHRAYRNLPALGAHGLDTTPGWAVGYFFIPFANLVKPFQVVREIWRKSRPVGEERESFGGVSPHAGTPALVGWWWAFWIIANIAGRVSERVDRAGTIESTIIGTWANIASDGLFIIAAVLAIVVVKRIDDFQEAKFKEMGGQGGPPPPPPESFETYRTA